jgi:hypothetical protein
VKSNARRLIEAELASAEFRAGEIRGWWRLATPIDQLQWPCVFTRVRAAPRPNSPDEWLVRWDVDNYTAQRCTGGFWDESKGEFLAAASWPKGREGSTVAAVFKTQGWAAPGRGFYHPWDRLAAPGHAEWTDVSFNWRPEITLTDYISQFHRWLNCEDYRGQ